MTVQLFILDKSTWTNYLLEKVNMDIDSLCMQIYAGPEKKKIFTGEDCWLPRVWGIVG